MQNTWEDFRKSFDNEQSARMAYYDICDTLMTRQYPDYSIYKSVDITEADNKKIPGSDSKKQAVYLGKFFTDHVSNSRKGQIRKSFNDNVPFMKANNINLWVLFLPKELSTEEKSWWENWTARLTEEVGITPIIYDGNQTLKLLAKFGLLSKWFKNITVENIEEKTTIETSTETNIDDDILDFSVEDNDNNTTEKTETTVTTITTTTNTTTTTTDNKQEEKIIESTTNQEEYPPSFAIVQNSNSTKVVNLPQTLKANNSFAAMSAAQNSAASSTQINTKSEEEKQSIEPTVEDLVLTYTYREKFNELEDIKLKLKESNPEQYEIFDLRRSLSKVENYICNFKVDNIAEMSPTDLLYKARIALSSEQYSRALYMYEYLNAKNTCPESSLDELKRGLESSDNNLQYKYEMIFGDLKFATRDYINAAELYETAKDRKDLNTEATVKYHEAMGEALLDIGEFEEAKNHFQKALELVPSDKEIEARRDFAKSIANGTNYFKHPWLRWMNIFIAPFAYLRARKKEPDNNEFKRYTTKLKNNALWGLFVILAIIIAAVVLLFLFRKVKEVVYEDEIQAQQNLTPAEYQLWKGNNYLNKITPKTPHYIDSAYEAFSRARRYENTSDSATEGLAKAESERRLYRDIVQQNISTDSATYFLSMRKPTEGLRLFKYRYDENDSTVGKFGYVDTNMNVVILPVYDFNYKTMDQTGETFKNGRAKVCLIKAPGDTIYFYIDKYGKKIEE